MDSKKPWQSKTIILSAILGVFAVIHSLGYLASADEWLKSHQDLGLMVISGVGMLLRVVSSGKIAIWGDDSQA